MHRIEGLGTWRIKLFPIHSPMSATATSAPAGMFCNSLKRIECLLVCGEDKGSSAVFTDECALFGWLDENHDYTSEQKT